jgi:type VI secretion system protein ImpJ
MQVAIDPKWLHAGWSWYVGVNSDRLSDRECRDLLKPGKLDWKIGSSQQVDLIFKRGLPGVLLAELPEAPRALPARQGWIFYEVKRDKENPAWKDVLATQTLAMRLTERLIINFENLQGQRSIEVATDGRRNALQFALFAVPSERP